MRRRFLSAGLAAALVLTGCSGDDGDPAEGRQQAVAWAERVCDSVAEGGAKLSEPPKLDPSSPEKALAGIIGYLGKLSAAVKGMETELRAAGAPPVRDGQSAYDKALATLDDIQTAVKKATSGLRKAKVDDPATLRSAMTTAGQEMAKVRQSEGPAADLKANPELYAVFAKAPSCKQIDNVNASAPEK